jgi:hypothetical protein
LALCTRAHEAQVGQEGIGQADQVQVCHGGLIHPVLIRAPPQQLPTVREERRHGPACFIPLHQVSGRECRIVRHASEDMLCGPVARADDRQRAKGPHLQSTSIDEAVVSLPVRRRRHERRGAASPEQMPAIAASLKLPARVEERAMALERGGNMNVARATGLAPSDRDRRDHTAPSP